MRSSTRIITPLSIGLALCATSAMAVPVSVTFGSDNDGLGGFANPTPVGTEVWSTSADSVNYAFGEIDEDEAHTSSLLRSFSLDTSDGQSYTIEGTVTLTAGYGDDNNRIGLLLFNDNATQTSDGGGGLWLRLHADSNSSGGIGIADGIAGTVLQGITPASNLSGSYSGDSWIGTTVTFKGDIEYTAGNINVDFTFTDQDNISDTVSTTVSAASYTGTHFGFTSKWRQRGDDGSARNAPAAFDYKSFSIVPEPSSLALLGLGGLCVLRRRRD